MTRSGSGSTHGSTASTRTSPARSPPAAACRWTASTTSPAAGWTGADAKEHGLVDELGGLRTALDLARSAGIPESVDVQPRVYPAHRWSPGYDRPSPATTPAASARLAAEASGPFAELAAFRCPATGHSRSRATTTCPADGPPQAAVRPLRTAQAATSVRLDIPSLVRMLETCTAAARGDVQAAGKL